MTIRMARPEEKAVLSELKNPKNDLHRNQFRENQDRRFDDVATGKASYLVAEENGQIVGHVFIRWNGNKTQHGYPTLQDLYIKEEERGKGIGTALLTKAEELVKEKEYRKLGLAVNANCNPRAYSLYERLGYKEVGTEPYLDGVYDGDEDWVIDLSKELG